MSEYSPSGVGACFTEDRLNMEESMDVLAGTPADVWYESITPDIPSKVTRISCSAVDNFAAYRDNVRITK